METPIPGPGWRNRLNYPMRRFVRLVNSVPDCLRCLPAELIGDRIITSAEMVGQENVIAGTDCGLRGRYPSQIAWAKLRDVH
jgi:hypothetical protein